MAFIIPDSDFFLEQKHLDYPIPETKPLDNPPVEYVDVVCGMQFRSINLDKDNVVSQHVHKVDHATVVGSGGARFWKNGKWVRDVWAFSAIEVKAGDEHLFQALANGTKLSCVYNTESEAFKQFMKEGD